MRRLLIACLVLAAGLASAQGVKRLNFYATEKQVGIEVEDEATFTNAVLKLPFNYDFDAGTNYLDASESVNDGAQSTANSRPTFVAEAGGVSAHYDFDGTDDFIDSQISRGADFSGSFTVAAWVNRDAAGAWGVVMSDQLVAIGNASFELRVRGDNDLPSFAMRDSVGTFSSVEGTGTIAAASWAHLAGVYQAGVQKLIYVDGTLIASNSQTSVQSVTQSAYIGVRPLSSTFPFDGGIDDARIYNRALTAAEILDIYNATSGAHP